LQDKLRTVSTQREAATAAAGAESGAARARGSRQRQRLIDACIAALHLYGPSRTTVEKVVAIADLSPGIVRFYFDSKDAMLLASLGYLATEFEERLLVPVGRLKDSPARALELLVDLYLDPEIASTRKISVWYSFWGEASSRQEYLDICGKNDDDFAVLVRQLMERLITETGARHLDADGVALGLIGVLEVLWQGFAFQSEESIDRAAARERSLAYLRSVFPGKFAAGAPPVTDASLPAWAYASAPLLALEREHLLRPTWQVVGHTVPEEHKGRATGKLRYVVHDLTHALDGATAGDLTPLEMTRAGPLVLARSPRASGEGRSPEGEGWPADWPDLRFGRVAEVAVAANWKIVVEQWLETLAPQRHFLAPNQLLDLTAGSSRLLQVVPEAADGSRLVCFELRAGRGAGRRAPSRRGGASPALEQQGALAESIQRSLGASPAPAKANATVPAALAGFRRSVTTLFPLLPQTRNTRP
jgi:TetR/AcrR family transcriptional regulator, transcriptional repressor of bet genes